MDRRVGSVRSTGIRSTVLLSLGLAIASMSGCGGQGSSAPANSGAGISLISVAVSPSNPSLSVGAVQQFSATATFKDGSTQNVTGSAAWGSSDTTKATIQSTGQAKPGLATAVAAGTVPITASFNGMSATAMLTITTTNQTLSSLAISPTNPSIGVAARQVPTDHDTHGKNFAAQVQPLDTNGNPNSSGKIVFTSIGMSDAADEFGMFRGIAAGDSGVNHITLLILNGALGGITANCWTAASGPAPCGANVGNQYDRVRDTVLAPAGVTEAQVQVVWIKEANGGPGAPNNDCGANGCAPLCDPSVSGCVNATDRTEALRYEAQLGEILRAAKTRWPSLKLAFLSSRIYAGYATIDLSPEPYAFEYGFSVKWEVQAQINQIRTSTVDAVAGDLNYNNGTVPWIAWGPYLWANGATPRGDGLLWCDGQSNAPCNGEVDFQSDGTHPNTQGQTKVANLLMNYFLNSPYSAWFRP